MINSFMNIETISRGLFTQQLGQNVTADNLAKTYRDASGYLISSRQRLDVVEAAPFFFGNSHGLMALGTGPLTQHITRLRNSFLDGQIQTESSILGQAEILANTLFQIQGIIAGATGTLDTALTNFAAAFTNLSANPLNVALRTDVVNSGVAFADLAHSQFSQVEELQDGMDVQIKQTVSDINQILQQLKSINSQLLGSQGANVNDLLDARDYAITKLSRLLNVRASFGTGGTSTVYLGGLALVDSAGAAILQTNLIDPHNSDLLSITVQSSESTITIADATSLIQGGNLGGELQARNVVLDSYKTQIDQIATSVINVTNTFHRSGYAADGITTGIDFFTGTGARDIGVNGSLVSDPTRALVAASSRVGVTANGQIAQFIGNIRNLLANNFVESFPTVNIAGSPIDPTQSVATQSFILAPSVGGGSFSVNSGIVTWTTADTVYSILDKINVADPNVQAVFSTTDQKFYMFSNNPINIADAVGNFTLFGQINNVLTSTIRMNNGFSITDPKISFNTPMNSSYNSQAFKVTPSASGSFTLNGLTFNYTNTQSLKTILSLINAGPWPNSTSAAFFTNTQTITIFSTKNPTPIQLIDKTGNFMVFTGLNGNVPVGSLSSTITNQINGQVSAQQLIQNQASASLTQLNNAQADIASIATTPGEHGEPIEMEQENALKSLIAFNAMLQVLQVIDQMYSDLVSIIGPPVQSSVFSQRL